MVSRNTNFPVISRFAPVLFSGAMHVVQRSIAHGADEIDILAAFPDGKKKLFAARVRPSRAPETLDSLLFDLLESFVTFIKKRLLKLHAVDAGRVFFMSRPEGRNDL